MEASRAFYGELFGWHAPRDADELGGYASFELDGRKAAGLMPLMSPEQPPSGGCYVCTDDAGKTTALVEQHGGAAVGPPMAVGDLGTMALYTDPNVALFGAGHERPAAVLLRRRPGHEDRAGARTGGARWCCR